MKKIVLLFLSVLFFSKVVWAAGFSPNSFSNFDVNEILEKIYVKVAVTIKIDEKKVKGVITFKEKSFDGNLTCSERYKATMEGKINGENVSAKMFLYNVKKGNTLYKVVVKGNKDTARWYLYNAQDVAIAEGSFSDNNESTKVIDEELFAKFSRTMERFGNACTLN